jgi:hypothetical protein
MEKVMWKDERGRRMEKCALKQDEGERGRKKEGERGSLKGRWMKGKG